MKTEQFDYDLPKRFIAQNPAFPRDGSRLLIYDTKTDKVWHKHFFEIGDFLRKNDVLVVNNSKVIPARIFFENKEIFLLKKLSRNKYLTMVRPGKYFKLSKKLILNKNLIAKVEKINEDGTRVIKFCFSGNLDQQLKKIGKTPFPPYITKTKAGNANYQTVYAKEEGSIAAPTAGLHFTKKLIARLKSEGVKMLEVMLHVGRGTFLPVSTNDIRQHKMHSEFFKIDQGTAKKLNQFKRDRKRIIAVGTTSVRVLESNFKQGKFYARAGETDIFIYPGSHHWQVVDSLITNFHLPKSTLIMLVASFLEGKGVKNPIEKVLQLYEIAKKKHYRFYSFGDAMFLI